MMTTHTAYPASLSRLPRPAGKTAGPAFATAAKAKAVKKVAPRVDPSALPETTQRIINELVGGLGLR